MSVENDNLCTCERDNSRRHCPYCGMLNFYAIKETTKRPHPLTGQITEDISNFRCRTCGKLFDDLQWRYECKAPPSLRMQQVKKRALSKDSLLRQAESGAKFDENDKRHFQKVVGMPYTTYMTMWRQVMKDKQEREKQIENATIAAEKLAKKPFGPLPIISAKKLTPLQYHIENCNYCMTHDENCDVAKQLELAEKMEQP